MWQIQNNAAAYIPNVQWLYLADGVAYQAYIAFIVTFVDFWGSFCFEGCTLWSNLGDLDLFRQSDNSEIIYMEFMLHFSS